ncbi:hypothetical protein [Aquimarina sp. EL_43]|nr:hypothetical protein [Aquimarina sp. EL_43]
MKNTKMFKVIALVGLMILGYSFTTVQDVHLSEKEKSQVLKENKQLIYTLFDSISYKSLDLIMRDRAFKNNSEAIPDLRDVTLDSIHLQFNSFDQSDKNIDSLQNYTKRFIKLRNQYSVSVFYSNEQFGDSLNTILKTNLISKSVIKHKGNEVPYIELINKIQRYIEFTKDSFKIIENRSEQLQNKNNKSANLLDTVLEEENREKSTSNFESVIKKYNWMLLIILIISLVLNGLLAFLFFRVKRKSNKNKDLAHIDDAPNTSEMNQKLIDIQKIETIINRRCQNYISRLNHQYNKDCVSSLSNTWKFLKKELLQEIRSNQFSDTDKLQKFLDHELENRVINLEEKLRTCNDKDNAERKIKQEIVAQNFILEYVSYNAVSPEKISNIVDHSVRNLIQELPDTITNHDLSNKIEDVKKHILNSINKTIRENLILYFPFTDDKGQLSDDKKSKIKKRDSALQLIMDPNDSSKATFRLLYDYSDMMQAGIQSYDIFLLPICNLTSENFNRTGSEIKQIGEDGQMQLVANQWEVVKKIMIKII